MASTLNALIKIQPNFVKVWEYQAHNLSYNISMEFDDYEYRYHWVKRGINFLRDGMPYNYRDHRMTDNLGFFTGLKIGRSDEKAQFRRLFRKDSAFHDSMSDQIEPSKYYAGDDYKYDNWKMAYWWYQKSRLMVEDESAPKYSNDMLFFQKRPAQLRNQATGLQDEYESTPLIQEIWKSAEKEWFAYGSRLLMNSKGVEITIEGMAKEEARLEEARNKLDALVPGARRRLIKQLQEIHGISDDDLRVLDIPADQRTDEDTELAHMINRRLYQLDANLHMKVASDPSLAKDPELQYSVNRAFNEVMGILAQIQTIDSHIQTTNYRYWRKRTQAEATPEALAAHQALFRANEMRRRSIFDDEYELDNETGEKKILKEGAISLYQDAFERWAEVMEMFPDLQDGHMATELVLRLTDYENMLKIAGMDWPLDHPLQEFIDKRAARSLPDELPTSESLGLNDEEMDEDKEAMDGDTKEMDKTDGEAEMKDGEKAEMKDGEKDELGSDAKPEKKMDEEEMDEKKDDASEKKMDKDEKSK